MPDSYFSSLSNLFPTSAVQSIAGHFGASERTVLSGIQSSIAAVLSGLAQKSNDKGFIGQVVQLATSTPENAATSALAHDALTNPNSSSLSGANQLLSGVFGGKLGSITDALSSQTGLRSTAISTLLSLGGTTVLSLLGNKFRDGSLNASSLPGFLQKESAALQGHLPVGFSAGTATVTTHKVDVNPVVAQTVQVEKSRSFWPWLLGLLVAALLLGYWWFHSRPEPVAVATPAPVVAPVPPKITSSYGTDLGSLVDVKLCDGSTVRVPERGMEGKLITFIEDPAHKPDKTSWFDFDRLLFDTDSATLQPQSTDQLNDVAATLKACPNIHLTVGGYTDNTGDAKHNQKLSQDRADSVVAQLETMGIAPNRLVAKGYGDHNPVADNSTEEGRALNRRISVLVTAK
jgi:outer membrane protein OmpA-like peptidoglycan-associated protein